MDEKQRELYINSLLLFMYKIVNCSGAISHKDKNEFLRAANTLKEFANVSTSKPLTRADVHEATVNTLADIARKGKLGPANLKIDAFSVGKKLLADDELRKGRM